MPCHDCAEELLGGPPAVTPWLLVWVLFASLVITAALLVLVALAEPEST